MIQNHHLPRVSSRKLYNWPDAICHRSIWNGTDSRSQEAYICMHASLWHSCTWRTQQIMHVDVLALTWLIQTSLQTMHCNGTTCPMSPHSGPVPHRSPMLMTACGCQTLAAVPTNDCMPGPPMSFDLHHSTWLSGMPFKDTREWMKRNVASQKTEEQETTERNNSYML